MTYFKCISILACTAAIALAGIANAQSNPPQWKPNVSYATGDLVQDLTQNSYRAIKPVPANTPNSQPISAYTFWQLDTVRTGAILTVGTGQTFPSFKDAWAYLASARIAPPGAVTIKFVTTGGAYDETFPTIFSLDHPFGSRISILGDNVAKVHLHFPKSSGFSVDGNNTLYGISGVTLDNASTLACSAIFTYAGGAIEVLDNLKFTGLWQNFVFADSASVIGVLGTNNQWVNGSSGTTSVGILAASGGLVRVTGTGFSYDGGSKLLSFGLFATLGGKIEVLNGTITHASVGAAASGGASIAIPGLGNKISGSLGEDIRVATSSNVFAVGASYTTSSVDATSHLFH